jgi:diguanylate cyclase (GGDEF)-like protein/PAS domain S-box-containing protein
LKEAPVAERRDGKLRIGVLSPLIAGSYMSALLSAIAEAVADDGGRLVAIQTLDPSQGSIDTRVPKYGLRAAWEQVAGFIVVLNAVDRSYLEALREAGKPVVLLSQKVEGFSCPVVQADNRGGVRLAIAHLIEHGHRRIAFVGSRFQSDTRERYEAYREALTDHGIHPDDSLLFETSDNLEGSGELAAKAMLAAGMPSTALVAATDYNALGVMKVLSEAGLDLPGDQAIVGFDDAEGESSVRPTLSSVRQSYSVTGRLAADLLLDMVAGRQVAAGVHRVPTSFVARESCGCATGTAVGMLGEPDPHLLPTPRDRLRFRLERLLNGTEPMAADQSAALDTAVEAIASSAQATGDGAPPARCAFREAAHALFSISPRWSTITVAVDCLRRYREELEASADSSTVAPDLEATITEMLVELSRSLAQRESTASTALHVQMRREHQLSMALVGGSMGDPRSLGWLDNTAARAGCLGLWSADREEGGDRQHLLTLSGAYTREAPPLQLPAQARVEDFPPLELFEDVEWAAGDISVVLPVKTKGMDLGLMAMVTPIEITHLTVRDLHFENNALVSVAVEREVMTEWLRAQTEDLARAYKRERDLVEEIRRSEERYALAARAANDGLWDWQLGTSSVYYSDRWKTMIGHQGAEIGTSPDEWFRRVHPADLARLRQAVSDCVAGKREVMECEHRLRAADGTYRWMLCQALAVRAAPDGSATRLVGSLTDVTAQRELEEKLRYGAHHDALTGLPNRTLFLDRLTQALARARRNPDAQIALLFLDLDGFKQVNDNLGHLVGDQLLVKVAERLGQRLRQSDTAARLGGDEFAVLLEDVHAPEALGAIADEISRRLCAPYDIDGEQVVISAAVGAALSTTGTERPDDMLRSADSAMYLAKLRARHRPAGAARPGENAPGQPDGAAGRQRVRSDQRKVAAGQQRVAAGQPEPSPATDNA